MSQVFHVVRCFACQSFQVQQVKTKQWSCKLCGEKQSLLKMRHTQVSCWSKYLDKGEEADLIDRQNVSVNMMDRKKTNDSWTCGQSTDSSRVPGRTTDPGCGGAWCAGFVSEEWEEPVGRLSQMRDGLPSCIDDITEATPLSRPQALRPGSYMFDSGDDFTFDL
ncbi:MRN complex-interacting protein isoform 3-T3 [Aulostomus maculatus]